MPFFKRRTLSIRFVGPNQEPDSLIANKLSVFRSPSEAEELSCHGEKACKANKSHSGRSSKSLIKWINSKAGNQLEMDALSAKWATPAPSSSNNIFATNKTNTPKQICKRTHLHMEKPSSAADSLMLMPAGVGWWWWLSDKYSNSTH